MCLVNVNKSTVPCRFVHVFPRNPKQKTCHVISTVFACISGSKTNTTNALPLDNKWFAKDFEDNVSWWWKWVTSRQIFYAAFQ